MEAQQQQQQQRKRMPPGITFLRSLRGHSNFTIGFYRASVLGITFLAYACYHATRKPISIVKSVLHPEQMLADSSAAAAPISAQEEQGWPPFIGKQGKSRLGLADVSFLSAYAIGMFFAGHLGDRLNLRYFLTVGMLVSAAFVALFGAAYWWQIHSMGYFIFVQVMAGVFQSTGWPSVVSVVAKWCDKSKRGIIMGIWNCHTSVGNIVGSLLAAHMLHLGWGWSFVAPSILMVAGALVVFFFLVVEPQDAELSSINAAGAAAAASGASRQPVTELTLLNQPAALTGDFKSVMINGSSQDIEGEEFKEVSLAGTDESESPVGFIDAWMIPGVAQFALCLFFSKLVAYTFLYWLPFYIRHTKIAGDYLSDKTAGLLSTLFDVGGMAGGVVAGYVSDRLEAKATTAAIFLYMGIPALVLYRLLGSVSLVVNILLMMLLGLFINGPYALITTAVSADLGTHSSLNGNAKALATVTAIIDGTGSAGAAIGPLLTGFISELGWDSVFAMLIFSTLIAGVLLTKLVAGEVRERFHNSGTPFERLGPEENQDIA